MAAAKKWAAEKEKTAKVAHSLQIMTSVMENGLCFASILSEFRKCGILTASFMSL